MSLPERKPMRELKFRAWDKENQHMAYSDKHEWDYKFSFDGKSGNLSCAINCCYCDTFGDEHDDWNELDNIMQYTELKDKNGKDIYEGDVLRKSGCLDAIVEFERVQFCIKGADSIRYVNNTIDGSIRNFPVDEYEVIGNIYENPELLQR